MGRRAQAGLARAQLAVEYLQQMGGNAGCQLQRLTDCVDGERVSSNRHDAHVQFSASVCDTRLSAPSLLPTLTSEAQMNTHLQSEQNETDVSRRGLVQALAAGAAASIATPASAQQTSAQQQGAVLAEATSADYTRDPTRWGSAEVAGLFPGFKHIDMRTKGAIIRLRHGGSGPPLLLLHGNPNNHVLWYAVAAKLAERYQVVLPDLRGYGDSSLPEPGPNLINYSFRVMAEDMIEVMANLGHQRFFLGGHDRGARVSHRMCLDHPERVIKMCLLDMLPNYHVWTSANKNWALNSWHWLFMAQPEPFPETLMSAVPAEWFLKSRAGSRNPPKVVFDEYIRCYTKKTIIGSCRDYRAGARIDFEMDTADKDRQIEMPVLILWGTRGQPPTQEFPTVWRKFAKNLVDAQPLPTGHYLQEEAPDQVHDYFVKFFVT
jgi:haloacetate dehalogenase